MKFRILLLVLLILSMGGTEALAARFQQSARTVGRFDYVEVPLTLDAPASGNPFVDASLTGEFTPSGTVAVKLAGFCDSDDGRVFRIRFMPMFAGQHRYEVRFRNGGTELKHAGDFTARSGRRSGVVRVDREHPTHFIFDGSGARFFYNSTTAYWLLGFRDDAVIRESIDRLARLKVNRIRVALSGRTASGMRWKEPLIDSNDDFQYRLEPWPAARAQDIENPGYDTTRFNLAHFRKTERMLGHARSRDLQVSLIFALDVADTHGGPEYLGPLRQFLHQRALKANNGIDPHEPIDYRRQLIERWAEVIIAAWSNRQPASLEVVIPRLEGVAFNRRYWMKDGSTGWIPRKGDSNIFRPAGPVDTDFPFLLARRAGSAEGLGSLAVFAMHTAVFGGPTFGADFPGHLQTNLTAAFGPKFVSIFGEGCAGDVNHVNPFNPDPQHWMNVSPAIGRAMAQVALTNLPWTSMVKPGLLAVRSAVVMAPVTPISYTEIDAAKKVMETLDQNGAAFLVVVDAWRKIFRKQFWDRHDGRLPQEVQVVRFDADTALVTLPHEIFTELGIAIKAASPFRRTMVVSLANDLDFYIPTRRAFEEGNYEPTTCPLEPGCGERLVAAAVKLLNELKP